MTPSLPLWLDVLVSVLILAGAGVALTASIGLLTLPSFFKRMHPPATVTTLGCWCILLGALTYFSWHDGTPMLRLLLIALFMATTVPITSIFLLRAALFRARRAGENVPANLSGPQPDTTGSGKSS